MRSFVCFSALLFLSIAILYLVVGSSLWLVPSQQVATQYVETQCEKAAEGNFEGMELDFKVVRYDVGDVFRVFADFDEQFATSVNGYMCTDFCICPGSPSDSHYQKYSEIKEEIYQKYNRSFLGFDGAIDLEAFSDSNAIKPLFWTFDPSTGTPRSNLQALSSQSAQ